VRYSPDDEGGPSVTTGQPGVDGHLISHIGNMRFNKDRCRYKFQGINWYFYLRLSIIVPYLGHKAKFRLLPYQRLLLLRSFRLGIISLHAINTLG
jgi:hypothetical protein